MLIDASLGGVFSDLDRIPPKHGFDPASPVLALFKEALEFPPVGNPA